MSDQAGQDIAPQPRDAPPRSGGRPALATAIGAVVMIAATINSRPAAAGYGLAERRGYLIGGALFGLIVWGVCYAITIRNASRGWKLLSLAMLMAIGLLAALAALGRQHQAIDQDARQTVDKVKRAMAAGPDGRIEAGAGAGPMTRLTAVVGNMILADSNGFTTAASAAGLQQAISFDGLTTAAPLLDHCDRLDALTPRATALADRYPVYLEAARAEGAKLVAAGDLAQAEADGLVRGLAGQQEAFHRQWTLAGELSGHAADLCRILARRHWTKGAGGAVQFTDSADLAAATAVRARLEPVMTEVNAIGTAARAKSEAAMHSLEGH